MLGQELALHFTLWQEGSYTTANVMGIVKLVPPAGFSHKELVSPDSQDALRKRRDEKVPKGLRCAMLARSTILPTGSVGFVGILELRRAPWP